MKIVAWLKTGLFLSALIFAGCNIFNPGGEGDPGNTNLNQQGEEYFRRGQYGKAMQAFEKAIAQDSTNSMAYYGYAKSAVQFYKLDKIGVINDAEATAKDPATFAFLQHSDSLLTLRLQAAYNVRRVLGLLTDRDTLTRWYNYLTDSSAADPGSDDYDSLYTQRRDFISQYLVHASFPDSTRYRRPASFPLTDFRMTYRNIIIDYTAIELLYTITRLYDLNRDNVIDSADAMMKKLKFGSSAGFQIDSLSLIAADLENDSAAASDLNVLITNLGSGLINTSQLTAMMGGGKKSDSSSTETQTSSNMDSVIASLGDAVLFYQFGDQIDNDGDGCIDEELLDERDNDFDGYVDEDARTIPATKSDGIDNDLNGRMDPPSPLQPSPFPAGNDSLEAPIGDALYPGHGHVLGFVYAYLDTTYQTVNGAPVKERNLNAPEILSTWVKIKKGSPEEELKIRLALQRDSLLVKRLPSGRLPDSLFNKLQNARNQVGGCWRNLKTVSE